jgi:NADH-quinone oxidoreductase subunit J
VGESLLVNILESCAVFFACLVVCLRNCVKSVLSLIACFVFTACVWVNLNAEFLAVVLVLVYVGAVLVLFVFVVMLVDTTQDNVPMAVQFSIVIFFTGIILLGLYKFLNISLLDWFNVIINEKMCYCKNTIEIIGLFLYATRLLPIVLAGILLLTGIIAAVGLVYRGNQDRKTQSVGHQVSAVSGVKLIKDL